MVKIGSSWYLICFLRKKSYFVLSVCVTARVEGQKSQFRKHWVISKDFFVLTKSIGHVTTI